MDTVTLNGTVYTKASSVARDFGYTKDYVGQLCRSGKIDAELVGRTWFVNVGSLKQHKSSRYRSTLAKTKDAVAKTKVISQSSRLSVAEKSDSKVLTEHFYDRAVTPNVTIRYEYDAEPLVPEVTPEKKQGKLSVELADAERVTIKKQSDQYQMTATKIPKIRFSGDLSVVSAEDDEATIPHADWPRRKVAPPEHLSHSITQPTTSPNTTRPTSTRASHKTVSGGQPLKEQVRLQSTELAHPRSVSIEVSEVDEVAVHSLPILARTTVVVAFILLMVLLSGLEHTVSATNTAAASAYNFDTEYFGDVKNMLKNIVFSS